jgi:hypothetical protein
MQRLAKALNLAAKEFSVRCMTRAVEPTARAHGRTEYET